MGLKTDDKTIKAVCPCCQETFAESVFAISQVPVMVATAFECAEDAQSSPRGDIDLVACNGCGFVFNRAFDQALAVAGARYESSQAASPHFSAFARGLAHDWVARYGLRGKRVVEVGCGEGHFMFELVQAGVGAVVGIDPLGRYSYPPPEGGQSVEIDTAEFSSAHATIVADALVCRHTIEHIADVSGFLQLVAAWASANPGAVVLIEVPAAERIYMEGAFWDVFYEHCSYFTQRTLAGAFCLAGFNVLRTDIVYDAQYLLLEATLPSSRTKPRMANERSQIDAELDAVGRFGRNASKAIDAARNRLHAFAAEKRPIAVWQGAAKTVGLLAGLGPDVRIDCAVDLNTARHGLYLPPTGLVVLPPRSLVDLQPGHIVLMNVVYLNEVRRMIDELGVSNAKLHGMNSICTDPI